MLDRQEIIDRFRRWRALCSAHSTAAMTHLGRDVVVEQARRLGLADGRTVTARNREALSLIFDLALYHKRPGRSRAIDRYARNGRQVAGGEATLVLKAMQRARFGLWRIADRHEICGLVVSDLLDATIGCGHQWFVDEELETTAEPGSYLATRMCGINAFAMASGISILVTPTVLARALFDLSTHQREEPRCLANDPRLPAAIYCAALQHDKIGNTAATILPT